MVRWIVILTLLAASMDFAAAQTPRFDEIKSKCIRTQRAAAENKNVSDAQIDQYCGCVMRSMLRAATPVELDDLSRTGVNSPSLQAKLNDVGASCVARINLDEALIKSAANSCISSDQSGASPSAIRDYCFCVYRKSVSEMTEDQKAEVYRADKAPSPGLAKVMGSAVASCRRLP
jgi:hypothetical protein